MKRFLALAVAALLACSAASAQTLSPGSRARPGSRGPQNLNGSLNFGGQPSVAGNGLVANPLACVIGAPCVLGVIRGANFNSTSDQSFTVIPMTSGQPGFLSGVTKYFVTEIDTVNCSTSLTTAQGGVYTATSKGGTVIGATTTPYTGCTGAAFSSNSASRNRGTGLTNMDTKMFNAATLYLSLTTAQGGAATADLYVIGIPLN